MEFKAANIGDEETIVEVTPLPAEVPAPATPVEVPDKELEPV